ncbi:MAG: hypothetical protein HQK79_11100 [Desulfobacterales bacterium]|nr:hypothetical protein [Desulfobacterales bacterium]MBF0396591.1 hypothetical protein [Desulfobacterales bacterium]
MERAIIHLNIADFAVAVERKIDSRLKNRPLIIAPECSARGVVYDLSEEAYQSGVRKGMSALTAKRFCKEALILSPHMDRYERAMRAVLKYLIPFTPLIETGEHDGHLFADVTGTQKAFGTPMDIAWNVRKNIKSDIGVDPIWSVAPNKLLAKVASRLVKPDGEYIVACGEEEAFISPVPIHLIPGIENTELIKFQELNFKFTYQIVALNLLQLQVLFGSKGRVIYEIARGVDSSDVLPVDQKQPKVIFEHEFHDDTNDVSTLESILYYLVEQIGLELRKRRLAAGRIGIFISYSDGKRIIRSIGIKPQTANDIILFEFCLKVFYLAWVRRIRIRHVRIVCDKLTFPPAQMELFSCDRKKTEKLTKLISAIDDIRSRFGKEAIFNGRTYPLQNL